MNYEKMTKSELIALVKEQQHLAAAVEAKDAEISKLTRELTEKVARVEQKMTAEKDAAYVELTAKHTVEIKKLTDALAVSEKNLDDVDMLRVKQVNGLLYTYGDLLKVLQGITDTHMKLNTHIVKDMNGGN